VNKVNFPVKLFLIYSFILSFVGIGIGVPWLGLWLAWITPINILYLTILIMMGAMSYWAILALAVLVFSLHVYFVIFGLKLLKGKDFTSAK